MNTSNTKAPACTAITKYDLSERIMLLGLDGYNDKMSADQQRRVFGRALFGRKRIQISCEGQGEVWACWSAAFGTTTAGAGFTFDEIADYINHPEKQVRF
jgi:hypothetical protein